jgi:hypothetical protein
MQPLARIFIILGIAFLLMGGLLFLLGRFNLQLGHLPGDIRIEGKQGSFYFPLATCILISVVLTVIVNLIVRVFRK